MFALCALTWAEAAQRMCARVLTFCALAQAKHPHLYSHLYSPTQNYTFPSHTHAHAHTHG